ncbi:MAG: DUF1308 domain-containing protein [Candidatus Riflebacteria bacterium]|nr:DUF1308 domain-containing protein [Candidatus Riflebacteria bacterium]
MNLDTSTIIAVAAFTSPDRSRIYEYLAGKLKVATETARRELWGASIRKAGPVEAAGVEVFMQGVLSIPDRPSLRALSLAIGGEIKATDVQIFGTGDFWGMVTTTGDTRFLKAVWTQRRMVFAHWLHQGATFTGH